MSSNSVQWHSLEQPPLAPGVLAASSGHLTRFRIMAVLTGIGLIAGTVGIILKVTDAADLEPGLGYIWVAHGYLYLIYVIVTAMLGVRLRWPIPRFALVMIAGTIPTMSFVAEHYVTRAARAADGAQPVAV